MWGGGYADRGKRPGWRGDVEIFSRQLHYNDVCVGLPCLSGSGVGIGVGIGVGFGGGGRFLSRTNEQ